MVNSGPSTRQEPFRVVDRYAIFDEIAAGGMATVHLGRLLGPGGFSRTVAVKRLHEHLAKDSNFVDMFLDEARLAARITHPNVVQTVDIVPVDGQLYLVMEYVQGESLSRLLRTMRARGEPVPLPIAAAIMVGVLQGLHAAHEAMNERGEPLMIVHRDVSPQNVMVGRDGIPRVLDFGIAKAVGRMHTTRDGSLKGKLAYMAPEQIRKGEVTRVADVYAASVVLWEMLAGERLFGGENTGDNEAIVLERVLFHDVAAPSSRAKDLPAELDAIVLRGLSREATERFATARDMARAIEEVTRLASSSTIGEWVAEIAAEALSKRAMKVAEVELASDVRQLHTPSGPVSGARPVSFSSEASETHSAGQLTEIGTTTGGISTSALPRSNGRLVIGAGVALLALGILVAWSSLRSTPTAAALAPPPSTNAGVTASVAAPSTPQPPPAPPPAPVTAEASTAGEPSAAPARGGAGAGVPSTRVTPSTARPHPVATNAATPAKPSTPPGKPGCTPPYVIDAAGMKQYKLECL